MEWEMNIPFFLCSFVVPETNQPLDADPRSLLQSIVGRAEKDGYQCMSGTEFEVSDRSLRDESTDCHVVLSIQRDPGNIRGEGICQTQTFNAGK